MTYVLGLTGSIAMGKTATAALFAAEGIAVWDADAAVHRLYARDGAAVPLIASAFPAALVDGAISRHLLGGIVAADETALARVEDIVHPFVAADRNAFLAEAAGDIVVLDVPLLFESGTDELCDGIAVVSVAAEEQRRRALARPEMDEKKLASLLSRQMPDAEKRVRADWVIETTTPEAATSQVREIIAEIRKKLADA